MKKYLFFAFYFLSLCSLTSCAFADRPKAPDATLKGPYPVASGEYRFEAAIDADVLADRKTEIWAKVFWPQDMAKRGKAPLVIFLHGNHGTCGTSNHPRYDETTDYTDTGVCPPGYEVIRNHEGYNYLLENLASWGYWVVSINTNRGINGAGGDDSDPALIRARGKMVLKHLSLLYQWATVGGAPTSLGLGTQGLVGKIDFSRVGLFGHSRGGQGVRVAYNLYQEPHSSWQQKIPNLNIKAIYELASTDTPINNADDWDDHPVFADANGVAWNQLLPLCDGDVSDAQGRLPFERMMLNAHESATAQKSLYEIPGANHNFFNTEWQATDANNEYQCPNSIPIFDPMSWYSVKQQTLALASVPAFFRSHLDEAQEATFNRNFNPLFDLPDIAQSITQIYRDFTPSPNTVTESVVVDDFDKETGINSSGNHNFASQIDIEHKVIEEIPARVNQHRMAAISWQTASTNTFFESVWAAPNQGRNIPENATLDFRIARMDNKLNVDRQTSFNIVLEDASGKLSKPISIDNYALITGPWSHRLRHDPDNHMIHVANTLFQTVRIPVTAFEGIDLFRVHGVRFVFNETPTGALYLANIRFHKNKGMGSEDSDHLSINRLSAQDHTALTARHTATQAAPMIVAQHQNTIRSIRMMRETAATPSTVEIRLTSQVAFPVMDTLPTLSIGKKKFVVSHYSDARHLKEMAFTLTEAQYQTLSTTADITLSDGKVWKFGTLTQWLAKNKVAH